MEEIGIYIGTIVSLGLVFVILKEVARVIASLNDLTNKIASLVSITYEATHNPDVETKIVNQEKQSAD